MSRKKVSTSELHEILTAEFRKTAADHCLKCGIPMPVYFGGAKDGANWRIGTIGECSALCHTILEDVVALLATRYDVMPPRP